MKVQKNVPLEGGGNATEQDLIRINRFAKTPLKAEQVYVFPLRLCDNEIDRDYERFPADSLEKLAELFVGKTGLFDHQWTAKGQKARLFRVEVQRDGFTKNSIGEDYVNLKGWAYMLRTEENLELIAEIEGGIKQEVSVGCAVAETRCSICGKPLGMGGCSHKKGQRYGGKLCFGELCEPTDAYEWSFVAVPAQKKAGILKKSLEGGKQMTLKGFLEDRGNAELLAEMEALEKEAEMGRRYLDRLRGEVVRMGLMAEDKFSKEILAGAAEKMNEEELLSFKKAFAQRIDEIYPAAVQLGSRKSSTKSEAIREYLV